MDTSLCRRERLTSPFVTDTPKHSRWLKLCHNIDFHLTLLVRSRGAGGRDREFCWGLFCARGVAPCCSFPKSQLIASMTSILSGAAPVHPTIQSNKFCTYDVHWPGDTHVEGITTCARTVGASFAHVEIGNLVWTVSTFHESFIFDSGITRTSLGIHRHLFYGERPCLHSSNTGLVTSQTFLSTCDSTHHMLFLCCSLRHTTADLLFTIGTVV